MREAEKGYWHQREKKERREQRMMAMFITNMVDRGESGSKEMMIPLIVSFLVCFEFDFI